MNIYKYLFIKYTTRWTASIGNLPYMLIHRTYHWTIKYMKAFTNRFKLELLQYIVSFHLQNQVPVFAVYFSAPLTQIPQQQQLSGGALAVGKATTTLSGDCEGWERNLNCCSAAREGALPLPVLPCCIRSSALLLSLVRNCCSSALRTKLFRGIVFRAERSTKLLRGRLFIFSSWPSMCFGSHTLPAHILAHLYTLCTQHYDTLNSPCGGTWSRVILPFFFLDQFFFCLAVWKMTLLDLRSVYLRLCECVCLKGCASVCASVFCYSRPQRMS